MDSQRQPPAPAVVAVVVTCDPGSWFEQTLSGLADQDYPNLSVLVIDSASSEDPTVRVAAVLPGAYVSRLQHRFGFGRAANEVLKVVEGASHLLFCHDDVSLAPDAVRALVEEAFRSNAGIATPKYVEWDHPDRLLAVGATADKVGVVQDLVEPGELDQEQHDVVREVFAAPGGALLVRADLFRALGGFNATIDQFGEDFDLSWRARVAGARVVAVPAARVRHLQALRNGMRLGWGDPAAHKRADRLADGHRVRTMVTCYRWYALAWILPLAVIYMLGEAATRLLQGRPGDAVHTVGSFASAFRRPRRLWLSRRRVQRRRRVSDKELRRLQIKGNARLRSFLRTRVDDFREGLPPAPLADREWAGRPGAPGTGERRLASDGHADLWLAGTDWRGVLPGGSGARLATAGATTGVVIRTGELSPSTGTESALSPRFAPPRGPEGESQTWRPTLGDEPSTNWRVTAIAVGVLLLVLIIGSRSLTGHQLPAIGQLPQMSGGWSGLWRSWWSTWQVSGLGVSAPGTPALALLGLLGTVLFGAMGTLQHVVVLGPLLVGPLGAYRAARWWGSRRGRLAALIAYAVVPLPYNSLARGDWAGLLVYAAAPWVLSALARLSDEIPFPVTAARRTLGRVVGLGLLVAAVGAAVPSYVFVVPIAGAALLVGSALAGRARQGLQMFGVAIGATVVAVVLLLPWSATVLGSRAASLGVSGSPDVHLSFTQLLKFDTGPVGRGPLGWALLAVAALPLVIGRGWRLAWAIRLWTVAVVFFWVTWAGMRGWIPALPPGVGLASAGAALAGSAALGAVAFELDLSGYRFGWRQLAAAIAGVALGVAAIPMLIASGDGRWNLPSSDASSVLSFLPSPSGGDYRVLWVGAPAALPLAGRQLQPGVAFATSFDGMPNAADLWTPGSSGASPVLAEDLRLAESRLTTKLGHLLAPMAVRYLVIPNHNGPSGSGAVPVSTPGALLSGLQLQTDLEVVNADANYAVYQNAAWAPARGVLPPPAAPLAAAGRDSSARALQETDLTGTVPVLTGGSPDRVHGRVPYGSTVYVASTLDGSWRLKAGSASVAPTPAFGWAMSFSLPAAAGGVATLQIRTPVGLRVALMIEIFLWVAAIFIAAMDLRRRRNEYPPVETVRPEWFAPASSIRPRTGRTRSGKRGLGADDLQGEELWIDG
jgi:GT2 family glycosyltransferase